MKKQRMNFYIEDKLKKQVMKLAKKNRMTATKIINELLETWVENNKGGGSVKCG